MTEDEHWQAMLEIMRLPLPPARAEEENGLVTMQRILHRLG
jgi:hypothetical protein